VDGILAIPVFGCQTRIIIIEWRKPASHAVKKSLAGDPKHCDPIFLPNSRPSHVFSTTTSQRRPARSAYRAWPALGQFLEAIGRHSAEFHQ